MKLESTFQDVIDGAKNYEFWTTFGLNDIKSKFRRSRIGHWWPTINLAVFILSIGSLYGAVFSASSDHYLLYIAAGFITWQFLSGVVTGGCTVLYQAKPFLLQKKWPISTFVYRLMYAEVLEAAQNVILLPPIFLWLKFWPGLGEIALALLGFAFVTYTGFWVALFMAIVSLRFRDFPPIVQALMRVVFFLTPVMWTSGSMGSFGNWVELLNPFGYYLDIVRDPLMGAPASSFTWIVAIAISVLVTIISLFTLAISKNRLTYLL